MAIGNEVLIENVRKSLREFYMKDFKLDFKLDWENSDIGIQSDYVNVKIPITTNLALNINENISNSKTYKLIIRNNLFELSIPINKVLSNIGVESQMVQKEVERYFTDLDFQVNLIVESYKSCNS